MERSCWSFVSWEWVGS